MPTNCRITTAAGLLVSAVALAACAVPTPGAGSGPNPAVLADEEPVAFILERSDSLLLPDTVRARLVQLNLRLFQRNQPLRFAMDTILERTGGRPRPGRPPRPDDLSPDVRERIEPLLQQIRANNEAARDTAMTMLSERQRQRAEEMRQAAASRAQGAPPPGEGRRRP